MSSLVKSPDLSAAKLAANRANAAKSTGPITQQGKERGRLSNFRHGLYVLSPRDVLIALGENPMEFESYERALVERWQPSDAFQTALVLRIASNSWRLDRARRVQESTTVRELEKLELDRAVKGEKHARKVKGMLAAMNELLEMARQGDLGDVNAALAAFERAYGAKPGGRGKDVLDLMRALSPALRRGKEQAPPPEERERISTRLVELLQAEMESVRRYDEGYRLLHIEITPAERGSAMGPVQVHSSTMIRLEESLARRLERDVRLLLCLKGEDARVLDSFGGM